MPVFSARSKEKLLTCHEDLQRLFNKVIEHRDCTIICGYRGEVEQNEAYFNGHSKLMYPQSMHNKRPSLAVDVAPYFDCEPHIRWEDTYSFYNFIGYVQGIADTMNIKIRSGADWDNDSDFHDQSFFDTPHYELIVGSK